MRGIELAQLRRNLGLSQSVVAAKIGMSRQTVSYWERKPTLDGRIPAIKLIANAIDPSGRCGILQARPEPGFYSLHLTGGAIASGWEYLRFAMSNRERVLKENIRQICQAKNRKGTLCQLKTEPGRKRCRLHGGTSTGPKTEEGRSRIAEAQRRRWAEWRERQRMRAGEIGN